MSPAAPKPKRIRLVDVAREANISVQAVSHIMSGNETVRIPESTRARVKEIARQIGYVPNRLAQAMKTGRTNVMAIWLPLDRPTHTYFRMLERLTNKGKECGISMMIIGIDRNMAYKGEGTTPAYWPVDGIFAVDAGKAIRHFRNDPSNDDTPVVVLALEEYNNSDNVAWDVLAAAKSAISNAIRAGKKHIVHLSPRWVVDEYPREQRRRGYTEAMEEAGLNPVIIPVTKESSDAAEIAMAEYLSENSNVEAVFGFLDNIAIGAARAILTAGKRIPEDVWVIGFGDTPEAADFRVPLTSVQVPTDDLIDQAWEWMLERIENPSLDRRSAILPMTEIKRKSTDCS